MTDKVFAFDLGKASIGICARDGHRILELQSLIIPAEFAMTSDFRDRRRAMRTRKAHVKREEWLNKIWTEAGLELLSKSDLHFTREFAAKNGNVIYNSASLRIALLQGQNLEAWQIYKALHSAIQHRGYDPNQWKEDSKQDEFDEQTKKDEEENKKGIGEYEEGLQSCLGNRTEYSYPCYYEAYLMGLWDPANPSELKPQMNHLAATVRMKGRVAPRSLVEKELRELFIQAQKQLPKLQNTNVEEFLFGPSQIAYASLKQAEYFRLRGTEWDAQGVLSQKIPRFDNRLMNKCRLLPLRNTCNAQEPLNLKFGLLMRLKNLRFTDSDGVAQRGLTVEELNKMFTELSPSLELQSPNITLTKLKKALKVSVGNSYEVNMFGGDWKFKKGGRSSFCRPALTIVCDILSSGIDPKDFAYSKYIQNHDSENSKLGITKTELEEMFKKLPRLWENFSILDNRYEFLDTSKEDREEEINQVIGNVNNPIVRNRLQIFLNNLKRLENEYGKPDKVIFEFIRGSTGLQGSKTANEFEKFIKQNEKINDEKVAKLKEVGLTVNRKNIEKLKLLDEQDGRCPYSGVSLAPSELDSYQVDHISPLSGDISADSMFNKVLCLAIANQGKGDNTPYEWLSKNPDTWKEFQSRITSMKKLGNRKRKILLSDDAREQVESYNGLAETAYMSRLCQQIVSLYFNWGLQTKDDARRIFVSNGKETAAIRRKYNLNKLLISTEERANIDRKEQIKKNRSNPLHHALDAYCISYSQAVKFDKSKQYHENELDKWYCEGLEDSIGELKQKFTEIYPRYVKRNTKELYPNETIYGMKSRIDPKTGKTAYYMTVRKDLMQYLAEKGKSKEETSKRLKNLWDKEIQEDLELKFKNISQSATWFEGWTAFLDNYHHPKRQSKIRKIVIIDSTPSEEFATDINGRRFIDEYKDYGKLNKTIGQFKRTKMHKGQIVYYNTKGIAKVRPIYGHESLKSVQEKLKEQDCKLYMNGMMFYSGCDLSIPIEFQGEKKKQFRPGIYKLNSINILGTAKLTSRNGEEFVTSLSHLTKAGFQVAEYIKSKQPALSI